MVLPWKRSTALFAGASGSYHAPSSGCVSVVMETSWVFRNAAAGPPSEAQEARCVRAGDERLFLVLEIEALQCRHGIVEPHVEAVVAAEGDPVGAHQADQVHVDQVVV